MHSTLKEKTNLIEHFFFSYFRNIKTKIIAEKKNSNLKFLITFSMINRIKKRLYKNNSITGWIISFSSNQIDTFVRCNIHKLHDYRWVTIHLLDLQLPEKQRMKSIGKDIHWIYLKINISIGTITINGMNFEITVEISSIESTLRRRR